VAEEHKPSLKVGTGGTVVEITSDPHVIYTYKGYAPVVDVRVLDSGSERILFVSAQSLAAALEDIRLVEGTLVGRRVKLAKESAEQFARYVVTELP
jgi:hypothetical protein